MNLRQYGILEKSLTHYIVLVIENIMENLAIFYDPKFNEN